MNKDLQTDLSRTHGILNYISAGYQGRYAFLNILAQFGWQVEPQEIPKTQDGIQKAAEWTKDLYKGAPLFSASWDKPKTFDSERALQILEGLVPELQGIALEIVNIYGAGDLKENRNGVTFLIAAYGRSAYARDNYVRGFIEYGKHYDKPEMVKQYLQILQSVTEDLKLVHEFLKAFKEKEDQEQGFYDHLLYQCWKLPGSFRSQAHDIIQVVADYSGGLTFERLGINEERAREWKRIKGVPQIAGYWEAFFMGPEDTEGWINIGITDYNIAAEWRKHGFEHGAAAPWHANRFPPFIAMQWANSGFTAERAVELINRGYTTPEEATRYIQENES